DDEYIGIYTKLSKKELEYNTYIAEAKEEGFNDGEKSGERNKQLEIAKNLLNQNINIHVICIATGLTIEEIESLK
ncbi:MAG: ATPase, partial [Bacilli bacterium]|nr:ATPase [Bacilli bacterium]